MLDMWLKGQGQAYELVNNRQITVPIKCIHDNYENGEGKITVEPFWSYIQFTKGMPRDLLQIRHNGSQSYEWVDHREVEHTQQCPTGFRYPFRQSDEDNGPVLSFPTCFLLCGVSADYGKSLNWSSGTYGREYLLEIIREEQAVFSASCEKPFVWCGPVMIRWKERLSIRTDRQIGRVTIHGWHLKSLC